MFLLFSYLCLKMIELSLNMSVMSTVETYRNIADVMLEKLVERMERDKICPMCGVECDFHNGDTYIVYKCPDCRTKRVERI